MRVYLIVMFYLLLLVLAVPWYWPASHHAIYFGVPGWVVMAVVVSFITSVLTGCLLARQWAHEAQDQHD